MYGCDILLDKKTIIVENAREEKTLIKFRLLIRENENIICLT